jgi:hypothetical protein
MKKIAMSALIIGCVLSAENYILDENCFNDPVTKKVTCTKQVVFTIESTGQGVVPSNVVSVAQAKAMARRAAIIDAYKSLAEKIYGIKINGKDSVRNLMLQNSTVRSYVSGVIRGASIDEESYKDGIYTVTMSVKIDSNDWNKIISNTASN